MTAMMITTVDLPGLASQINREHVQAEQQHIGAIKRLQSGDRIRVKGMGTFIVTDNDDPALIVVHGQHGATLRLGRLILQLENVQSAEPSRGLLECQ